ncbi:hypothetical protein BGZ46_010604 [Entomortierella lignicola]|nr:hypothetical protein BGZ46_010604 [Entomortierella lignicola]
MVLNQSTATLQRALLRSVATNRQAMNKVWPSPQRNQALQRYFLYSTNSHQNRPAHAATTSFSSSTPGSPSTDSIKASPNKSSGSLLGWVRRLSLMSASAAAGAFAYSKMESVGMEPSLVMKENPDGNLSATIQLTAEETKEVKRAGLLEAKMHELDLVLEYKDKVQKGEWKEVDAYWYLTKATEPHHLLATSLRGENMLGVTPLKFERKDKKAVVLFMHLGRSLCGHDRIIHGGLLATLLDDATGMVALPNLPFHIGFTANLNINYRKPVKADQFVMIKAEFEKSEGRKGFTSASIHDLNGNTLVECTALYISPKNPVVMVASYVKNSLGL